MSKRLCCIFRRPALYREPIHRLMEASFDIDWHFGDDEQDIKSYDVSILKHCNTLHVKMLFGSLYYAKGELGLLFSKKYDTYLMLNSTHNVSVWVFALCKRLFFRKKRVYYWCHGWYGKETGMEGFIKRSLFKAANGVFTYGERARQLLMEQGFDGNKIWPIHNSLNHEQQVALRKSGLKSTVYQEYFGNSQPVLLFIGRLTKVKQLDMLIEALSRLYDQGQDFNLVLVGDGEQRQMLQEFAKSKGLADRIWFYGACYDEQTNAKLIYNADLCVAPGNIGLTAMHSLVFGTPCLTHDSFEWQMPEVEAVKEGQTGTFFKRNDVTSLTESICQWFSVHQDREAVRQACYDEIDNYWTPQFQIGIMKSKLLSEDKIR